MTILVTSPVLVDRLIMSLTDLNIVSGLSIAFQLTV